MPGKPAFLLVVVAAMLCWLTPAMGENVGRTRVTVVNGQWHLNGTITHPGSAAEGLLMNVRMVNAIFEDRAKHLDFDAEANTDRFIARIPDYAAHGVNAFTICLQGGMPGYEGAVNSAFEPDGCLRDAYLQRYAGHRACDRQGDGGHPRLYYQRQSKVLRDEAAVRAGVVNAAKWVRERGFRNVLLEVANEYPHQGFAHPVIRDPQGQASLIKLARNIAPGLLVSASGYGDGAIHPEVAAAADFLLAALEHTKVEQIPARIAALEEVRQAHRNQRRRQARRRRRRRHASYRRERRQLWAHAAAA